jgi:hypothetical protein
MIEYLILSGELIDVYTQNHMKLINILCEANFRIIIR